MDMGLGFLGCHVPGPEFSGEITWCSPEKSLGILRRNHQGPYVLLTVVMYSSHIRKEVPCYVAQLPNIHEEES